MKRRWCINKKTQACHRAPQFPNIQCAPNDFTPRAVGTWLETTSGSLAHSSFRRRFPSSSKVIESYKWVEIVKKMLAYL